MKPSSPREDPSSYRNTFRSAFVNPYRLSGALAVEDTGQELGILKEHSRGELFVYAELDPKETYVIGADVGMGVRGGDPSCAQILDSQLRQVAVWNGSIHPDAFAKVLATLGYHYHSALVAVEINNHGLVAGHRPPRYAVRKSIH